MIWLPTTFAALVLVWIGWRLVSRRWVLPCPADFAWLVEMENPLARAARSAEIVSLLGVRPGESVVDIGCGPGRVALPLARAVGSGGDVVALDVQQAMLDKVAVKAEREGLGNLRTVCADVRAASLPAETFDAATLVMALGEVPDPTGVFVTVRNLLRPEGRLVVAESVFDPHYQREAKVRAMAVAAGFEVRRKTGNRLGYALLLARPASPSG